MLPDVPVIIPPAVCAPVMVLPVELVEISPPAFKDPVVKFVAELRTILPVELIFCCIVEDPAPKLDTEFPLDPPSAVTSAVSIEPPVDTATRFPPVARAPVDVFPPDMVETSPPASNAPVEILVAASRAIKPAAVTSAIFIAPVVESAVTSPPDVSDPIARKFKLAFRSILPSTSIAIVVRSPAAVKTIFPVDKRSALISISPAVEVIFGAEAITSPAAVKTILSAEVKSLDNKISLVAEEISVVDPELTPAIEAVSSEVISIAPVELINLRDVYVPSESAVTVPPAVC